MTHIRVIKLTIIGSDNGLSPGWRQAIIWTNAGILLIEHLGTNFSEILIGIKTFSVNKMHLKMSSAKWRPFCLGLNVLTKKCSTCIYSVLAVEDFCHFHTASTREKVVSAARNQAGNVIMHGKHAINRGIIVTISSCLTVWSYSKLTVVFQQ